MSEKLNFGNSENDPLSGFDSAPEPGGIDLSGFDAATGSTTIPAGNYVCKIERGELTTTKKGKPAYRLRFSVVAPAAHAGVALWKWLTLAASEKMTYQEAMNKAKTALAPFGLTTGAHLREPFPSFGKEVYCQCLVTSKIDELYGPSNDVERFAPCSAPHRATPTGCNPYAVPLDETEEGGTP